MTQKYIALGQLALPEGFNPRRSLDKSRIKGLAKSIKEDGVLQNLVVQPNGGDTYHVLTGKRRYLALSLLKRQGVIDDKYRVPVTVKRDIDDGTARRIATVENVQREALDPLDEAEAFASLLKDGENLDDIVAKTGVSKDTIRRRLALANLCDTAKEALRDGLITLSVAEGLTVGSESQQQFFVQAAREGADLHADDVRSSILADKPSVSMAVFPKEKYQGTLTSDLFGEDASTYFDDFEEFMRLQEEAVNQKAERYRKKHPFVEVLREYRPSWWQYHEAREGEEGGVVINLSPTGAVEIRKNVVKTAIPEETEEELKEPSEQKNRSPYGPSFWRYVSTHRSIIAQAVLLQNPRRQKEVAVTLLLTSPLMGSRIRMDIHPCLRAFAEGTMPKAFQLLLERIAAIIRKLKLEDIGEPALWPLTGANNRRTVIRALSTLPDEDLDLLLAAIPVLTFGQSCIEGQEPGDSFFSSVFNGLGINLRDWWTPDEAFLSLLKRDELERVAVDCGASLNLKPLISYKKKELVSLLVAYFARTANGECRDEHEARGAAWVHSALLEASEPEPMQ
jgi:ParB family chromosome partitioning protein